MRILIERFRPFLSLILHLCHTETGMALSWDDIELQIDNAVHNELEQIPPADILPADLQACRLAAYAFADEKLASRSGNDGSAGGWFSRTLQRKLLHTDQAGDLFYDALRRLSLRLPRVADHPLQTLPEIFASAETVLKNRSSSESCSASESIAFFGWCLLCGFRGRLRDDLSSLQKARGAAFHLLSVCDSKEQEMPAVTLDPEKPVPISADPEALLHWLVPAAISIIWYILCTDFVTSISIP
ncbi:MAG: DotU family type IV/VI secretion system protein [Desulfovibrionaceae bacterium]|nr:DotU family type IV/VI secretion system protein [Desulfovibrionaceae bacterium]